MDSDSVEANIIAAHQANMISLDELKECSDKLKPDPHRQKIISENDDIIDETSIVDKFQLVGCLTGIVIGVAIGYIGIKLFNNLRST